MRVLKCSKISSIHKTENGIVLSYVKLRRGLGEVAKATWIVVP